MATFLVHFYIHKEAALLSGSTAYGQHEYQPTPQQLQELSPDELRHLSRFDGKHKVLPLAEPHPGLNNSSGVSLWTAIAKALFDDLEKHEEKQRKDAEVHLRAVEIWLSMSDSEILKNTDVTEQASIYVFDSIRDDPRVRARLENLAPKFDAILQAQKEYRDKQLQERETEKALKVRQEAEARAQIREYALRIEHLSRAAAENYDVIGGVLDHIAERIAARLPETYEASVIVENSPEWMDAAWSERKTPSAHSFQIYDYVKSQLGKVDRPECVLFKLNRIQRFEIQGVRFTGVLVQLFIEAIPNVRERAVIIKAE